MSTKRVQRTVTSAPSVSADHASRADLPDASWSATASCAEDRDSLQAYLDELGAS